MCLNVWQGDSLKKNSSCCTTPTYSLGIVVNRSNFSTKHPVSPNEIRSSCFFSFGLVVRSFVCCINVVPLSSFGIYQFGLLLLLLFAAIIIVITIIIIMVLVIIVIICVFRIVCSLPAWYTQSRLLSRKASDVRDSYIDLSVPYTHGL